jgi:hypothetical protein
MAATRLPGETDVDAGKPGLLTMAEYARRMGVSRQAIHRQVATGMIPAHGPRKLIDPAVADSWYVPRIDAGQPQCRAPGPPTGADAAEVRDWRRWADAVLAVIVELDSVAAMRAHLMCELDRRLVALGLLDAAEYDGPAAP